MTEAVAAAPADLVIDPKRDRLVIFASTLGTIFEWYDFFIYGTLAGVISVQFFPSWRIIDCLMIDWFSGRATVTDSAGFSICDIGEPCWSCDNSCGVMRVRTGGPASAPETRAIRRKEAFMGGR